MATIKAPNPDFNGARQGVTFVNGVGETDDPAALNWFERRGYTVEVGAENEGPHADLDGMNVPELKELAKGMGIRGYSDMKRDALVDAIIDEREKGSVVEGLGTIDPDADDVDDEDGAEEEDGE